MPSYVTYGLVWYEVIAYEIAWFGMTSSHEKTTSERIQARGWGGLGG
jgi:hypothetical protein